MRPIRLAFAFLLVSSACSPADLTIGHIVSVWFRGPVMESNPVHGTAAQIVIEPAGAVNP